MKELVKTYTPKVIIDFLKKVLLFFRSLFLVFVFIFKGKKLFKYLERLPDENKKNINKSDIYDIFGINLQKNFDFENNEEIDIIMRTKEKEISSNNSLLVNAKVTDKNRNNIFITGDNGYAEYYKKEKVDFILIKILNNNKGLHEYDSDDNQDKIITLSINSNHDKIPLGSGLATILAISLVFNKVNIYGWNFYQEKQMSKMNSLEFLYNVFFIQFSYSHIYVESFLYNLFFVKQLGKLNNININGNLVYYTNNNLDRFFTKRISNIFLKLDDKE